MTQEQWCECQRPRDMLSFLMAGDKATDRQLQLLTAACCRLAWPLLPGASRRAVEMAERLADHPVDDLDLFTTVRAAVEAACAIAEPEANLAAEMAYRSASRDGWYAAAAVGYGPDAAAEAAVLRDIFGDPFRPVTIDRSLLTWRGGLLVELARDAYERRELPSGHLDRGRLTVLADALEEAGCTVHEILGHLRDPGLHTRGCWAVDLLLNNT